MPTDKPRVSLNLDTIERDGTRPDPFVVVLGGKPRTFADPSDVDWQKLTDAQVAANGGDYRPLLRIGLADDDDRRAFFEAKLPGWKIGRLLREWQAHYGVTSAGEPSASSPS